MTVNLGTTPQKGQNMVGFEPFANQRLLPPTFPRYTEIKARTSTFEYLQSLVDRLLYVAMNVVSQSQSFHSALEYFAELSAFTPCVLSRSTAQILYQPLGLGANHNFICSLIKIYTKIERMREGPRYLNK